MSAESPETLIRLTKEYKEGNFNPKQVAGFWQTAINFALELSRTDYPKIVVPVCDRSEDELLELKSQDRCMVYNPNLPLEILTKAFLSSQPHTATYRMLHMAEFRDQFYHAGWVDVEAGLDSPYPGYSEPKLQDLFVSQGRAGQRFSTYLWFAYVSKLVSQHYPDETGFSRLLGTNFKYGWDKEGQRLEEKDFVIVSFKQREGLTIVKPAALKKKDFVGGRSEGFKNIS